MKRWIALIAVLSASLALGVACDGDSSGSADQTATPAATSTPAPTEVRLETEGGEAPVFWRAADGLSSLVANEAYKVLFRITNGYEEPALSIGAVRQEDDSEIQITSNRAEPVGEDLPGSYYPTFLLLPSAGTWELTILAGADSVTITVEVAEGPATP